MNVFITGATGFIGVNLVEMLDAQGISSTALVRDASPTTLLPASVTTVTGNLRDPSTYEDQLDGVDAVVHLAAVYDGYTGTLADQQGVDWERVKSVNVDGTRSLITAADACGVDRFVFMSSILAHPQHGRDLEQDYQRSKRLGERLLVEDDHAFTYTILYPTFVVGPNDYRLNRFQHFQRVATNVVFAPPLYAPGQYNVVHVKDVAATIVESLAGPTPIRQIVSGENISAGTLYSTISDLVTTRGFVVPVPYAITKHVLPPVIDRLHERDLFPAPGSQFRKKTNGGVVPAALTDQAPVDVRSARETLADAVAWYESVGLL